MTLSFAVLGSGSLGNCTLVRLEQGRHQRHLLIDAGLSPRRTAARLAPFGVHLEDITDVLLTHLDHDHFHAGWVRTVNRHRIAVHAHRRHRRRLTSLDGPVHDLNLFQSRFELGPRTEVHGVLLAHDQLGTVGYVIEHLGVRLGYATDLGRVTHGLLEHFEDLHALALEANYDPGLQRQSDRPEFLKNRIMGGMGHLSNEQSLEAVLRIAERSRLCHVAALHLSRQCNSPRLLKRLFAERAPHLLDRLTITSQQHATPLLRVSHDAAPATAARSGEQMALFG